MGLIARLWRNQWAVAAHKMVESSQRVVRSITDWLPWHGPDTVYCLGHVYDFSDEQRREEFLAHVNSPILFTCARPTLPLGFVPSACKLRSSAGMVGCA
jgi:hypothetical protein